MIVEHPVVLLASLARYSKNVDNSVNDKWCGGQTSVAIGYPVSIISAAVGDLLARAHLRV